MQTKKKLSSRNARDHASPRVSRPQKKISENVQVAERKVTELITSSPRRQKCGSFPPKNIKEAIPAKHAGYVMPDEIHNVCLGYDKKDEVFVDAEGHEDGAAHRILETIFSPTFHISKDVGGGIEDAVDFIKYFKREDETVYQEGIRASSTDMIKSFASVESSISVNKVVHNRAAGPAICSSDMDVDSDMSSDHSEIWKNDCRTLYQETSVGNSNEIVGGNLSSEVSAIYLAMQQSKLECVDEPHQNTFSTSIYVEEDDVEEIDYFDPYLFIKNLPDLSSVVPSFRPMLLPKQTRSCPRTTLVLDLDETLVHSTLEPCSNADFTFPVNFNLMKHTVYVRCRPHLMDFMERVASLFEIIIFTASQSIYAEQLLNVLDPKRKMIRHRVYRDSCVFVEGNYLKDLSILGRDLSRVIIIDNSPQAFGFQVDNGIPIESWFEDRSDKELLLLLPFLESLVGAEDVRPLIAEKFNLRRKIATATYPYPKGIQFVR